MSKLYINNGGQHKLPGKNGKIISKGERFSSDDPDLLKKFPCKFTEVITAPAVEEEKTPVQEAAEKGAEGVAAPKADADVTADFPKAKAAGLTVTKSTAGWNVFDGDDEPANDKPMKKKEAVAFIADYLA